MRKNVLIFLAVAVIALGSAGLAGAQERWIGSYEFEESGGKTAGGTGIVIMHQIDISESDDGLIAQIKASGFQTSRDLVAKVRIDGQKAMFYFESYGEDNILEPYKEGDLLFTLERKAGQLLTTWGTYQPGTDKYSKSAKVYFQKLKTVEE